MKRFTIFSFLWSKMMFQNYIVDNDGAGGGDDNTDIGDIDINDDDIDNNNDDTDNSSNGNSNNSNESGNSDELEKLRKQVETLQADKVARDTTDATNTAVAELQSKHQGFESNKVQEYLTELNKTNPEKANELNTPVGWENIWLNEFATANVNNDSPSFGRNVAPVDRSEEVLEKVKDGEIISVNDELEIYGNLL